MVKKQETETVATEIKYADSEMGLRLFSGGLVFC